MSRNLRTYLQALNGLDATIQRVDPQRWGGASPCEGWTALDVLSHVLDGQNGIVALLGQSTEPTSEPLAASNALTHWRSSYRRLVAALDAQGALQLEAKTPFGFMTIDRFLGIVSVDPLTHTWDLAIATGQTPLLDPLLVAKATNQLDQAGDAIRGPGMFAADQRDADASTNSDNEAAAALAHFVELTGRSSKGPTKLVQTAQDWLLADSHAQTLRVELDSVSDFIVQLRFTVSEEQCNSHGSLHGGVSFSAADIGLATLSNLLEPDAVAIATNLVFCAGAKVGETVVVRCETLKRGRSLGFFRAELRVGERLVGAFGGTTKTIDKVS